MVFAAAVAEEEDGCRRHRPPWIVNDVVEKYIAIIFLI